MVNADKRPYPIGFASLWVPQTKVLGGNLGLSLGSSDVFSWAHGEVTGLINFEDTVQGWCFGDTMARAQLGWARGRIRSILPPGFRPGAISAASIRTREKMPMASISDGASPDRKSEVMAFGHKLGRHCKVRV